MVKSYKQPRVTRVNISNWRLSLYFNKTVKFKYSHGIFGHVVIISQLSILHKKVVANIIPENQIERLFLLFKVWVIGPSAQLLDPGVMGLGKLFFRSLRSFADSTVTRGLDLVSNF